MITCIKQIFILLTMVGSYSAITAQHMLNEEKRAVPLEASVRYGRLNNGFTYYIKNVDDASKVYLKLYVNVGNFDEDDRQWQLAHTLEHLAFRESTNFPEGGIKGNIATLGNIGMKQHEINGHTQNNYTSYTFDAPPKNREALTTGLLWFKDITSGGLKLLDNTIEKERGIVLQELLGKIGDPEVFFADNNLKAALFPGIREIHDFDFLKTFKKVDLKRFYHDWYRPDLTAISVVGDIENVKEVETQIKAYFSTIPRDRDVKKPVDLEAAYLRQPPKFAVVKRKANPSGKSEVTTKIQLLFRDNIARHQRHDWRGIQRNALWELFSQIINTRYRQATNSYNPFFKAIANYTDNESFPAFHVTITSTNNREKEALYRTIEVLRQIRENGVLDQELKEFKGRQLGYFKVRQNEYQYWERGIREHFIYGKAFPTNKENKLSEWLSSLSLEEFNVFLKEVFPEDPEDIGVIAPEGHPALSLTEQRVRSWISKALHKTPKEPYRIPETSKTLMSKVDIERLHPQGYTDKGITASKAHEYVLANGVKVVLKSFKPSPGLVKKPDIIMQGFSPKGAICYPSENYFSAINASAIVINSGVRDLDKFQLENHLSNNEHSLNVHPYIYYSETGIRGDTDIKDLETMLQLVYLYFTNPRKDPLAFKDWKLNALRNETVASRQFENDFRYEVKKAIGDSLFFVEQPGIGKTFLKGSAYFKGICKTDLDQGYQIYRELFGNARDFTFIFSGDFCRDTVLTLARKYLGNLPNSDPFSCTITPTRASALPKGPVYKEIDIWDYKHNSDLRQGYYNLKFLKQANTHREWKEQIKVKCLGFLTSLKLKSLRGKGLPLYSFGAVGSFNKDLLQYEVNFFLRTDSEYFPILQKECKQIVSNIKNGGIDEDLFNEAYKQLRHFYDEDRLNQNFVTSYLLYEHYRYQIPLVKPSTLQQYIESLTLKDIVSFASKFYAEENQFEFLTEN